MTEAATLAHAQSLAVGRVFLSADMIFRAITFEEVLSVILTAPQVRQDGGYHFITG